jgi:hypothetical protein
MEENQNEVSPLAAFPQEHPSPTPSNSHPFYRSKTVLLSGVVLLLLCVGVGGYMMLGKNQKAPTEKIAAQLPSPTPTITAPTPKAITADWKSYKNASYAYEVKYAQDTPGKEANTSQYGLTDFANGCFKVYTVPKGTEKNITAQQNDIPWNQLEDLKTLSVGSTKNCSILTFTFGEHGANVNKNDYKKLPNQQIADTTWYAFDVSTGEDKNITGHNVYFTEKNNFVYLIETKTGGSCPPTDATDMLTTFSFIK